MVLSRILKRMVIAFKKGCLFFIFIFILLCYWIKQAEIGKNCGKH